MLSSNTTSGDDLEDGEQRALATLVYICRFGHTETQHVHRLTAMDPFIVKKKKKKEPYRKKTMLKGQKNKNT